MVLGNSLWMVLLEQGVGQNDLQRSFPQLFSDSVTREQTQPTLVEHFHYFFLLKDYVISEYNSIIV